MKFYFILLFKRLNRNFKYLGIEPLIVYIVIPVLFYWVSTGFFDRVLYANYLYIAISAFLVFGFGNIEYDDFLKQHFSASKYQKIVLLSNMLIVTPFAMFLVYKLYFIEMFLVYLSAIFVSFLKKRRKISIVIPTPFSKKPTEFVIGFRRTFWMFLCVYGLAIIAVIKGNFNLGLFSIVSVFLICSSYYMKRDSEFYIWIHAMNSKEFLKNKIVVALQYSIVLTIPLLITLSVFYFDQIQAALLFFILGEMYLIMYVLMKYAFQYEGVEVFQMIIGGLCFLFPPIMVIAIPYFYKKAVDNLNLILE